MRSSFDPYAIPPTFVPGFHNKEAVRKTKYKKMGMTNMIVSKVGLGGGPFGGLYGETEEVGAIVKEALTLGVNYIDTSFWYGQERSEELLGEALLDIPRQAYYISVKVGQYQHDYTDMFDFRKQNVLDSFEKSLNRLRLDYVDVVQLHDVDFVKTEEMLFNETLPAMNVIKHSGKARYVGLTGYSMENLKKIIEKTHVDIDLVQIYCRGTIFDNALVDYVRYFRNKNDMGIVNAACMGMGLLSQGGPPLWHPAPLELKTACAKAKKACEVQGFDIGKLATHYSVNIPGVHTTLCGVHSLEILHENLDGSWNELNKVDDLFRQKLVAKYFATCDRNNWEGVKLHAHWERIVGSILKPPTYVRNFHDDAAVARTSYRQLGHTDMLVSKLGLGGGPFGGLYGGTENVDKIVKTALVLGINYIDTAYWHGQVRSEELIGKALRRVPRRAYYIGVKVGRYDQDYARKVDFRSQHALQSFNDSLSRLQLDYVDVVQMQIPDLGFDTTASTILQETLPALDLIRRSGRARYVAVAGYPLEKLRIIIENSSVPIDLVVTYSRGTLFDNTLQKHLSYFQDTGIGVINASCAGLGLLTQEGPLPWHPAPEELKLACKKAVKMCQDEGYDIAQLATNFGISLAGVHVTLCGAHTLNVLLQNLNTSWFGLGKDEENFTQNLILRCFNDLYNHDWEGMEVQKVWRHLKKLKIWKK